jgi:hypothetical protein
VSYISDELVGLAADVRPRRYFTFNGAAGEYSAPAVEPYLLFVLTHIDVGIGTPLAGQQVSFALQPAGSEFFLVVAPSTGPVAFNWRGWLPMESGDYIAIGVGLSCGIVMSGVTYPNNV